MFRQLKDRCLEIGFDDEGYFNLIIDDYSITPAKKLAKVLKDSDCTVQIKKHDSGGWLVKFKTNQPLKEEMENKEKEKKTKPKARIVKNQLLEYLKKQYAGKTEKVYPTLSDDNRENFTVRSERQMMNNIRESKHLIAAHQKATVKRSY